VSVGLIPAPSPIQMSADLCSALGMTRRLPTFWVPFEIPVIDQNGLHWAWKKVL
jgi:hypothetical protein